MTVGIFPNTGAQRLPYLKWMPPCGTTYSIVGAAWRAVRIGVLTMVLIGWLGITATGWAGVFFYESGRDGWGVVAMVVGLATTAAALFAAGALRKSDQSLSRQP
jgi:hypothetical protein